MTESEWRICTDPEAMLRMVCKTMSKRKRQLFCVACCRRLADHLNDEAMRLLEILERASDHRLSSARQVELSDNAMALADGLSYHMGTPTGCARWLAANAVWKATESPKAPLACVTTAMAAAQAVEVASEDASKFDVKLPGPPLTGAVSEKVAQAQLLKCIVAPFRVTRDCSNEWRTSAVLGIANDCYEKRHFEDLPILADALEDAGCTDDALLSHLRSPGPHYRGCWALDAILCKK